MSGGYYKPVLASVRFMREFGCPSGTGVCVDSLRVGQEAGVVLATRLTVWAFTWAGFEAGIASAHGTRRSAWSLASAPTVAQSPTASVTFASVRFVARVRPLPRVDATVGAGPAIVLLGGQAYDDAASSYVIDLGRMAFSFAGNVGLQLSPKLRAELSAANYLYRVRFGYPNQHPLNIRSVSMHDFTLSAALSLMVGQ